jgi:hypothetical protein
MTTVIALIAGGIMAMRLVAGGTSGDPGMSPYDAGADADRTGDSGVSLVVDEQATETVSDIDAEAAMNVAPRSWGSDENALSGRVTYDDIPGPSQIEGDYSANDVKDVVVRHIQDNYPTEAIDAIQLIGNGTAPSQEGDETSSYACYLVTLRSQIDVGLFVECSENTPPNVTEARYLVVNQTLLYDVANKEYIVLQ